MGPKPPVVLCLQPCPGRCVVLRLHSVCGRDALYATLFAGCGGGVGGDALCASLYAGGRGGLVLFAEAMRCMLKAVEVVPKVLVLKVVRGCAEGGRGAEGGEGVVEVCADGG